MVEFILKYWIEVLFGLVVSGLCVLWKRAKKSYTLERKQERGEFLTEIKKEINTEMTRSANEEKHLQQEIDLVNTEIKNITKGILSLQRRTFIEDCQYLLDDEHEITLDEYQQIDADHEAYNGLGGNHRGDMLFALVKKKAENTFTIPGE